MPKAKPDQVIVHRLELQETERATLEAALAGRFVTNTVSAVGGVLSGIGSALAPFQGAISALAALWIADRTLDEILDAARASGEAIKQQHEEEYHTAGSKHIEYFSAWLNSTYENGGWTAVCNRDNVIEFYQEVAFPFSPHYLPGWFIMRCLGFLEYVCADGFDPSGRTPVELWAGYDGVPGWYSVEEYGRDAYYYATNGTAAGGVWHTLKSIPKGPLGKALPKSWSPEDQGW